MNKRMPSITIGGNAISPDWEPSRPVVLSRVRHEWGREGLYDPNEPGRLTVEVIDPTGAWVGAPVNYQAPITMQVDTGGGAVFTFRGWIDQASIRRHPYTRPDGQQGIGWIGRFTATDMIAALAKITTTGTEDLVPPGNQFSREYKRSKYGNGYWRLSGSNVNRTADIQARINATGLGVTVTAPTDPPPLDAGHPNLSAGDDLYTRIVSVYGRDAAFPADVRYHPHEQQIRPGHLAAAGVLALSYVNAVIVVVAGPAAGAPAPFTVPANAVGIPDDASITAALSHNITSVRVHTFDITRGTEMFTGSDGVARAYAVEPQRDTPVDFPVPGAVGFNQYDVPTEVNFASNDPTYHETPSTFANRVIAVIQQLNDRVYPPPITFHLDRVDYPAGVIDALLCGHGVDNAWTFPGAIFEGVPGFGPYFQLIGAIAEYDDGWTVTGIFGPARSTAGGALAINQLVTVPTPQLNQYDPSITLATLGTVTEGVH